MIELAITAFTVVSIVVRTTVFVVNVAGRVLDPLPADQGPQLPAVHQVRQQTYARQTEERVVVEYYWASDCRPCGNFHDDFRIGSANRDQLDRKYRIVAFELRHNRARANERGVKSLPAFYVPSQGRLICGYQSSQWLLDQLQGPAGPPPADPLPAPIPETVPKAATPAESGEPRAESEPQPATTNEQPATINQEPEPDEPKGLLGKVETWVFGGLIALFNSLVSWALSYWHQWRAEQGFIKGKFIDHGARKFLKKLQGQLEQSELGRQAWQAAAEAAEQSLTERAQAPAAKDYLRKGPQP